MAQPLGGPAPGAAASPGAAPGVPPGLAALVQQQHLCLDAIYAAARAGPAESASRVLEGLMAVADLEARSLAVAAVSAQARLRAAAAEAEAAAAAHASARARAAALRRDLDKQRLEARRPSEATEDACEREVASRCPSRL